MVYPVISKTVGYDGVKERSCRVLKKILFSLFITTYYNLSTKFLYFPAKNISLIFAEHLLVEHTLTWPTRRLVFA